MVASITEIALIERSVMSVSGGLGKLGTALDMNFQPLQDNCGAGLEKELRSRKPPDDLRNIGSSYRQGEGTEDASCLPPS